MSANPYKEEKLARVFIDDKMKMLVKHKLKELNYSLLVRQCLINFSVSRRMVENFIQDFYIKTKEVDLVDSVLKKAEV